VPTCQNKLKSLITIIIIGGGLLIPPSFFAQNTIDLTDGICSEAFLESMRKVSLSYFNDLGSPENLANLIDSTYKQGDYIGTILYIYIAHHEKGLEETYLVDIARVLSDAGCNQLPDSLFDLHLSEFPEDDTVRGDYALFLASRKRYKDAEELLEDRLDEFDDEDKSFLMENLALVKLMEYLDEKDEDDLEDAFKYSRVARFGEDRDRSYLDYGILELLSESYVSKEYGKYRFSLKTNHKAGSDAFLISLSGWVVFGRELARELPGNSLLEVRDLFGTVYIAPGESLFSASGAFEIIGDQGDFAPFYQGDAKIELKALFPDGSIQRVRTASRIETQIEGRFSDLYDALSYGETEWAESLMQSYSDSGVLLPERWRSSVLLSKIMEDPEQWESGIDIVDSLIQRRLDPNLWVYKGALLFLTGDYEEAQYMFERVIQADSVNFWAYYNLALVEYERGNKAEAAKLFLKTSGINPRMYVANLLAGVIYEELGQYHIAIEQYRLALLNVSFRAIEINQWINDLEERLREEELKPQ